MNDQTQTHRSPVRRLLSNRASGWVVAAALACAVIVFSVVLAVSPSGTSEQPAAGSGSSGAGSNARSGPAEGGALGTVEDPATSGFTLTTATGEQVTVEEGSATTYLDGTTSISASDLTTGETVLVLGMTDGTTITATQVSVEPNGDGGAAASQAAGVVPFQQGASSTTKQVGQIPDYTDGPGTIVSGTTADKATEAALAAYPGGVVDRVVQLSGGEYEVHTIGVNWPHHVFVDQDFTVVGAN